MTTPKPTLNEDFIIKHYTWDAHPTLKGNGFDGLIIGNDREEAEEFVAVINALRIENAALNAELDGLYAERKEWQE